jgi:multidrug resistance efflux pump
MNFFSRVSGVVAHVGEDVIANQIVGKKVQVEFDTDGEITFMEGHITSLKLDSDGTADVIVAMEDNLILKVKVT